MPAAYKDYRLDSDIWTLQQLLLKEQHSVSHNHYQEIAQWLSGGPSCLSSEKAKLSMGACHIVILSQ